MNIVELIGSRVLLKIGGSSTYSRQEVTEYKILELSPSGNWAKIQNMYGNKYWKPLQEISFVEKLQELSADRPKDV